MSGGLGLIPPITASTTASATAQGGARKVFTTVQTLVVASSILISSHNFVRPFLNLLPDSWLRLASSRISPHQTREESVATSCPSDLRGVIVFLPVERL